MQYTITDSRTGQSLTPWCRVWKTKLFAEKFERMQKARRVKSLVIQARTPPVYGAAGPGVMHLTRATDVGPSELKDPTSPYYWDTAFPRRSGRRGLPPS